MIVHPELAALQRDDTPQRRVQRDLVKAQKAWLAGPEGSAIQRELAQLATGAPLEDLPVLESLFVPGDVSAERFVGGIVGRLAADLADRPLGQVPLRHYCDPLLATLTLARCHGASLVLQAADGRGLFGRPEPVSASFSPNETWDRVLAGAAVVERIALEEPGPGARTFKRSQVRLATGAIAHRDGRLEAQLFRRIDRALVTLKLQRRIPGHEVTREYALSDGRLLHQAAADPRDSRLELTAALLGRMGRTDAAPLLAAMAEEDGTPHLRWQALRECLGLDSARGFAALTALSRRDGDPLAHPAGALRAQLLETYPDLARIASCPA